MSEGPSSELPTTAAGALLRRLETLGVDVVFTNSGTDFPPIIEALAEARAHDVAVPDMLVVPHEHVAMGMAHGYYEATGRAQAVILHTNVGLANGAIGALNAATEQVPLLLMSGRTPTTERGRFGSRTVPIGWGQEMRDQTALVREACKWDYELRFPEQVAELADRAHAIANSTPRGPVYLGLPREVLAEACPAATLARAPTMRPAEVLADRALLADAAAALLAAERPLIVAQRGAGTPEGFDALARLAERHAVPVCQYWAVRNSIAADHPMYVGQDPGPWIADADVIFVIDSLAPWMPDAHCPAPGCTVVQLAPDPLFERFPVRNFRSDLTVRGEVGPALVALDSMLAETSGAQAAPVDERRRRIIEWNQARIEAMSAEARRGEGPPMSKTWVSQCVGEAIAGHTVTVASELGCPLDPLGLIEHGAWRQEPHSGGLGWSLPYAMGLKLADPDRLVVATMGDGSYLFANPVACHQVAARHDIAVLAVVLNNGSYGAVRASVLGQYPNGYAAKADPMPLVDIPTSGELAAVARACGAHAERVERGAELPGALDRAMKAVAQGRHALVEALVE